MNSRDKYLRMAIIAGASCALNYKEKNPRATESEVLKHVSSEIKSILENIN